MGPLDLLLVRAANQTTAMAAAVSNRGKITTGDSETVLGGGSASEGGDGVMSRPAVSLTDYSEFDMSGKSLFTLLLLLLQTTRFLIY